MIVLGIVHELQKQQEERSIHSVDTYLFEQRVSPIFARLSNEPNSITADRLYLA